MSRTSSATRLAVEPLEAREVPATLFALNQVGRLLTFDSANPSVLLSGVTITGLAVADERITDIDVRPGSGLLYGRSTADLLYTINPFSGFATRLPGFVNVASPSVGMDFDPTTDRLRVVGNAGENVAINPNNGVPVFFGAPLAYAAGDFAQGLAPRVTGLGFTNSLPFALTTTGYGIDHVRNTLVRFTGPVETGQLRTVGSLGFDVTGLVGFDIAAGGTFGFAAFRTPGSASSIFSLVNLNTGAATVIGPIGNSRLVSDIAILSGSFFPSPPVFLPPVPTTPGFTPTPLFPTLFQPLAPGLVSPGFGFFGPTFPSSPSLFSTGGSTTNPFNPF